MLLRGVARISRPKLNSGSGFGTRFLMDSWHQSYIQLGADASRVTIMRGSELLLEWLEETEQPLFFKEQA